MPRSFATSAATVQTELAFQASFSCRAGPSSSRLAATRQITGSSGIFGRGPPVSARAAPKVPNGPTSERAPVNPITDRRDNRCRPALGGAVCKLSRSRVSIGLSSKSSDKWRELRKTCRDTSGAQCACSQGQGVAYDFFYIVQLALSGGKLLSCAPRRSPTYERDRLGCKGGAAKPALAKGLPKGLNSAQRTPSEGKHDALQAHLRR